jgi:hypothetical protein
VFFHHPKARIGSGGWGRGETDLFVPTVQLLAATRAIRVLLKALREGRCQHEFRVVADWAWEILLQVELTCLIHLGQFATDFASTLSIQAYNLVSTDGP